MCAHPVLAQHQTFKVSSWNLSFWTKAFCVSEKISGKIMGCLAPRGKFFVLLIHPNKTSAVQHVCWKEGDVSGSELRHLFREPDTSVAAKHHFFGKVPHLLFPAATHRHKPHTLSQQTSSQEGFQASPTSLLCVQDTSTLRAGTDPWIPLGKTSALHLPVPQHHSVQTPLSATILCFLLISAELIAVLPFFSTHNIKHLQIHVTQGKFPFYSQTEVTCWYTDTPVG